MALDRIEAQREIGNRNRTRYLNDFIIPYDKGKQVQEILNRYINEELKPNIAALEGGLMIDAEIQNAIEKDIIYIQELAKLFD